MKKSAKLCIRIKIENKEEADKHLNHQQYIYLMLNICFIGIVINNDHPFEAKSTDLI